MSTAKKLSAKAAAGSSKSGSSGADAPHQTNRSEGDDRGCTSPPPNGGPTRGEREVIPVRKLLLSWKAYLSAAMFALYSVWMYFIVYPNDLQAWFPGTGGILRAGDWELDLWGRPSGSVDLNGRVPVLEPAYISDLSIAIPVAASIGYVLFCMFARWWMNREGAEPFDLKELMFVYNVYQAFFNLWFAVSVFVEVMQLNFSFWGNVFDPSPRGYYLSALIWIHYNNKYVEWLDTVFIVLRIKKTQLSGLHTYHHLSILWAWWLVCRFMPGSDAYFGCLINSSVHVLMYLYYAIALLGYQAPWKRYLTQIQLAQFFICLVQAAYILYLGNVPRFLSLCQLWVMVSLMFLFRIFYASAYPGARPPQSKSKKSDPKKTE